MQAVEITADPRISKKRLSLAWWAVVFRFLLHGLIVGTWVSRIPSIREGLNLNDATLGSCLLGTAVGSVVAAPSAGWLIGKLGSKAVTTWSTLGFGAVLILPSLAFNPVSLLAALVLYGAMGGANDVSMNAQAAAVEHLLQRPTMSRFHAMFSIGGMLGSGLGGVAAQYGLTSRLHFAIAALVFLTVSVFTSPLLLEVHDQASRTHGRFHLRHIPPVLIALVTIGLAMFVSEGAIADWSGVYVKLTLHGSAASAAVAYASFSGGMTVFRLLGDAVTHRMGPVDTLRAGAFLAASGLAIALSSPSPGLAMPAFALTGAGCSVIVPLAFAASSRIKDIPRATGIAFVSGAGYIGFLFGPPLIGWIAQQVSLRIALCLIIALSVLAGALAPAVRSPNSGV